VRTGIFLADLLAKDSINPMEGIVEGLEKLSDACRTMPNVIRFARDNPFLVDMLLRRANEQPTDSSLLTADDASNLVDQSTEAELSPAEKEIFLVLMKRIKERAEEGYRFANWDTLDRQCDCRNSRTPRILEEFRRLGFSVGERSISWPKVVKS
jgi:hypothetical protein